MKFILLILFLSSCSSISYSDKHGQWSRYAFGTNVQLQRVIVTVGPDGSRSIRADGVSSDQTEAIKAAVEGAVEGMAKGIKP